MSRRRPDPHRARLEEALSAALRMAAESVEPAPDGLERIRARISAGQAARRAGWRSLGTAGDGPAWLGPSRWPGLLGASLAHLVRLVGERFGPDPARAGRLGWLRPAAAVATGLFVVAAASWLITGLPQVIQPANDSGGLAGGNGAGRNVSVPASPTRTRTSTGGVPWQGQSHYGQQSPSATCTPGQGPQHASPTSSPSGSPSASPSGSPSPSVSPSPSASPTDSLSPASSPAAAPGAAPAGIVQALLAPRAGSSVSPAPSGPATAPTSSPSPGAPSPSPSGASPSRTAGSSTSPGPCGSP
ncbi:MAG TPA: hypothetical protein VF834_06300 [Streptosporangiaceae bacterium]